MVAKARMFEFKPDGEVTIRMAQDANGLPAPLMQARTLPRLLARWLGARSRVLAFGRAGWLAEAGWMPCCSLA